MDWENYDYSVFPLKFTEKKPSGRQENVYENLNYGYIWRK